MPPNPNLRSTITTTTLPTLLLATLRHALSRRQSISSNPIGNNDSSLQDSAPVTTTTTSHFSFSGNDYSNNNSNTSSSIGNASAAIVAIVTIVVVVVILILYSRQTQGLADRRAQQQGSSGARKPWLPVSGSGGEGGLALAPPYAYPPAVPVREAPRAMKQAHLGGGKGGRWSDGDEV